MRIILEAVVMVLVITLMRSILGALLKGVNDLLRPSSPGPSDARAGQRVPTADELKKDPVCGTYIAASTSVKKTVAGQTYHFCSAECRDKFRAPGLQPGVRRAG